MNASFGQNKDDFEPFVIPPLKNSSCSLIFKEKYLLQSIIVVLYTLFEIMIEKKVEIIADSLIYGRIHANAMSKFMIIFSLTSISSQNVIQVTQILIVENRAVILKF